MPKNSVHAHPDPTVSLLVLLTLVLLATGIGAHFAVRAWVRAHRSASPRTRTYARRRRGELTFNKDIAPIVFKYCTSCHRPGQPAPFTLLGYQDVKKRASNIAEVTLRRYMPPWLPEPGYGEFSDERRLSVDEIGRIQQWLAEGAVEGEPSDLPPSPQWSGDWYLGPPDLVVTMPEAYTLAADGREVYRNFVIPVPVTASRYVQGVEFHPDNPQIVHHAFVKLDRTSQSRHLDAQDPEPGFPGMNVQAEMPGGHFLGWQPGRLPAFLPKGLSWQLDPGNDLVLQMHLKPSGKPERIQASVGLYYADQPPTNSCFKMSLTSLVLDIPAGMTNYVVEDSYVLPVDVQVLAVLPHAHYLAKEMESWATLPDGSQRWLLFIKQWDFNWHADYRYAKPLELPAGTTLRMRFAYDNSTNNVHNPNHPPRPVTYGAQSTDEMGQLWFQLLPRNSQDFARLSRDYQAKMARVFLDYALYALRKKPNDPEAHTELGMILMNQGRRAEAEGHFAAALQSSPEYEPAHYHLGVLLREQGRTTEARAEFEAALRLDPKDYKAHGNLGFLFLEQGDLEQADQHLKAALRINPDDTLARRGLVDIEKIKNNASQRQAP